MPKDQTMHTLTGPSPFPTTRWTVVVGAGDPQRKEARSALVSLCETYWYPLYAYLRRGVTRRIRRRI
jgi:RNA polymerase sigma-70 factor (ECF subfamily)